MQLLNIVIYALTFSISHQWRYLVFTQLIATTALVVEIVNHRRLIPLHYTALILGTLSMCMVAGGVHIHYAFYQSAYTSNIRNVKNLNAVVQSFGANTIISGHTYASIMKFWSNNQLQIAPVLYCNQNMPFLTREQWYVPNDKTRNVAIIVDRTGRDANSWQCGKDSFIAYFGTPLANFSGKGINDDPIDGFIYPKEVLNKIQFIREKGTPRPLIN